MCSVQSYKPRLLAGVGCIYAYRVVSRVRNQAQKCLGCVDASPEDAPVVYWKDAAEVTHDEEESSTAIAACAGSWPDIMHVDPECQDDPCDLGPATIPDFPMKASSEDISSTKLKHSEKQTAVAEEETSVAIAACVDAGPHSVDVDPECQDDLCDLGPASIPDFSAPGGNEPATTSGNNQSDPSDSVPFFTLV